MSKRIQKIELAAIVGRRGYAPDIIVNTETGEQVAACANPDLTALFVAAPEMYELLERAGEIMNELESLIDNAFTNDASAQKSQWLKDADALLAKIEGGEE